MPTKQQVQRTRESLKIIQEKYRNATQGERIIKTNKEREEEAREIKSKKPKTYEDYVKESRMSQEEKYSALRDSRIYNYE